MPNTAQNTFIKPQTLTIKPIMLYHYHGDTFELLSKGMSATDPIDGLPLIPLLATEIAPPKAVLGKIAVLDIAKQTWANKPDFRGIVYDTKTLASEDWQTIGILPAGKTALKPANDLQSWDGKAKAWFVDIAKVRAARVVLLKTDYESAMKTGVTYQTAVFQADAASTKTLTETLTALNNGWALPTGFSWLDTSNTPHAANILWLQGLSTVMANHKAALFTRLQIAKSAITAASTVAAVDKIVL